MDRHLVSDVSVVSHLATVLSDLTWSELTNRKRRVPHSHGVAVIVAVDVVDVDDALLNMGDKDNSVRSMQDELFRVTVRTSIPDYILAINIREKVDECLFRR